MTVEERAVVLLGAAGCGKSTLAAALLRAAGAPPAAAPGPGRLAYGALEHRGVRVSLLDPPGAPDLAGELHAGLRAAGAAVLVVSPVQGLDARTAQLWELCEAAGLPRLVVLTQLDRAGADADEAVAVCQRVLGEGVLPLQLPLHDDDGPVGGLLDLLSLRVSDASGQSVRAAEPEHLPLVEGLRDELVEAALTGSEDEELFDAWLEGSEPAPDVLRAELAAAVLRGDVQPAVVAVPPRGVGVAALLDLLVALLPPAADRVPPPVAHPDGSPFLLAGELVAEVVRTGLLRVWSGALVPGAAVLVGGRGPVPYDGPAAGAGALVETALLGLPGETVCTVEEPLVLAGWAVPTAQFPVGVRADAGLAERVAQDPVARLAEHPRTGQLLLWSYGPEHAELLLEGLPSAPVVVPAGGRPALLRIRVPQWCARTVRSDLTGRGGEVLGSTEDEGGVVIEARLPEAELVGYAVALARASASTGIFER